MEPPRPGSTGVMACCPLWAARGVRPTVAASVIGDVGFTVDRPTFTVGDQTLQLRITLVWHRESDGAWRVVHSHASMGQH